MNPVAYLNAGVNYCEALLRIAKPVTMPFSLDVGLTKACNLRCVFCISYESLKGVRWMPFEMYERIARKLFRTAHNINFCTGGEPLLYPRFRDALRLTKEYRCRTIVVSNGMLLDKSAAEWIAEDQSLHELKISFDGSTKQTLEKIRRGAKFDTIIGNIGYLGHLKRKKRAVFPKLSFRYAIMKGNVEELPGIFEICAKNHMAKVDVNYVNVPKSLDFGESLYNHPDLVAQVFKEARGKAVEHGIQLNLPPLPGQDKGGRSCFKPWHFMQIDTDGSIRHCYRSWQQRLGFIDDDFDEIWRGEHYCKIRRTQLSDSPYFPYCRHCANRLGFDFETSHNQQGSLGSGLIPGLESLQVGLNERLSENVSSFKGYRKHSCDMMK
ncbi:radical SAM protein [Thermodesulfobacteriota bacterium]